MRHLRGRRALRAALLATLLVLLGAPAAHAERAVVRDGSGDVWTETVPNGQPTEPAQPTAPPGRPDADVRRVVVDHRADAATVTARLTALPRGSADGTSYVELRTDAGLRLQVVAFYRGPGPDRLLLTSPEGVLDCPGAALSVRAGAARLRVVVPRSCLGEPAWVQARVAVSTTVGDVRFVDIAGTERYDTTAVWSSRVRVD